MFNNLFGLTCIRPGCGHKNPKGAEYCESCGISLAFNRPAILDGNRWSPAPEELAAFFKFQDMKKGFFTKTLWVPAGMKAWVLQDDAQHPVLLLDEGAHTTETLFQRMNNFFRSPHGEVLVAKTGSVPLEFEFDGLLSLERLALKATATLRVRVRTGEDAQRPDLAAFRRHFMQQPGVVTTEQLTRPDLLGKSVLAALKSFVGARSIDEMAASTSLEADLDTHLRNRMGPLLTDLGLELVEPSEFTLVHPKLDEQNRLQGELWLLRREKGLRQEHTKAWNDLYDADEREKLRVRRQEIERKRESGELDKEDAELARAMRMREVEQYGHIAQATTREQAVRMGAADAVERLEHEYARRRRQRQRDVDLERNVATVEDDEFAQIQALARIHRESALEIERLKASSQLAIERERAARELDALQRQYALDRAAQEEDAATRGAVAAQQAEIEHERRGLQFELESRRVLNEQADQEFTARIKRRETGRLQAWEDEQALDRIRRLRGDAAKAASDQGIDTARKWMMVARERELQQLEDELQREKLAHERAEATAQREFDQALELEADKRKTAAEAAESRRREYAQIGALPVEAMIAITESGVNVQALVETVRIKAQREMSAEQILAMQSGKPVSTAGPAAEGVFMRALSDQVTAMVRGMQEGQSAHHDQATSNLLRMHEGTLAALLRSQELLAGVAVGHAPAPVPLPAAQPVVVTVAPAQPAPLAGAQPSADACSQCNAAVQPYQRWCTQCGAAMCPVCRKASPQGAKFCWNCRHAFGA